MRIEKEIKRQKELEEMRQQVLEYKKQKEELNEYIEMEKFLIKQAELEVKRQEAKAEISNFQSRVLFFKKKFFQIKFQN